VKKLFLVVLATLVLGLAPVSAEVGDDKTFGVNADVFGLLFGVLSGSLEMKLPVPQVTELPPRQMSPTAPTTSGFPGSVVWIFWPRGVFITENCFPLKCPSIWRS